MKRIFRSNASLFHRVLAVTALGLGVLAVGCGSTADPGAVTADQAAQAAQAPQAQAVRGGVGVPFLRAVDTLTNLRPDQKQTIDGLRASLQQQAAPVTAARAKLGAELASEVRAGKIDESRIQPLVQQIAAARAASRPAIQQAMNTLHDTLDASQRQALVDAMHAHRGEHRGMMREHMAKIADELGLTEAQRESIKAAMHAERGEHRGHARGEHAEGKQHMQALATAFVSDDFDAAALNVGAHDGMEKHFEKRMTRLLEAAVPVLTADQREKLAAKIEARTQGAAQTADEE
jgi:hypothetical protein